MAAADFHKLPFVYVARRFNDTCDIKPERFMANFNEPDVQQRTDLKTAFQKFHLRPKNRQRATSDFDKNGRVESF